MSPRRSHRGDGARAVNPKAHDSKVSWWTLHAQPEDRANFMAEAAARSVERSHVENVKLAKGAWAAESFPQMVISQKSTR